MVYDGVSGGQEHAIIWLLLPLFVSFIVLVIQLAPLCFLDDHLMGTITHLHLVREELIAALNRLTIFFTL